MMPGQGPNWILHSMFNPLFPPLDAIPDAIRQVRDMSLEVSDAVEQHAKMLQDLLTREQDERAIRPKSDRATSNGPVGDGEIDPEASSPSSPSEAAVASLSNSVERILRNQAVIMADLKKMQTRQDAFEKSVIAAKTDLEDKFKDLERRIQSLGGQVNDHHFKYIHDTVKKEVNHTGHTAEINALWEYIVSLEQDFRGPSSGEHALLSKRDLNVCQLFTHYRRTAEVT
jgi:hypothetical protein